MIPHARTARRAFSLVEIMLVVALIGVIMAIAAVNLVGQGDRAKRSATVASMNMMESLLTQYYTEKSAYPPTLQTLITSGMMKDKPIEDGWKRPFYYQVTGNQAKPYEFISLGPDGKAGTADDIDIWTMNKKTQ